MPVAILDCRRKSPNEDAFAEMAGGASQATTSAKGWNLLTHDQGGLVLHRIARKPQGELLLPLSRDRAVSNLRSAWLVDSHLGTEARSRSGGDALPLGHILGIPVEETLPVILPAAAVVSLYVTAFRIRMSRRDDRHHT
jgi:hypothetical protein